MRFRTLLTHSQNVVGVFVYNGHHKRAVYIWGYITIMLWFSFSMNNSHI